MSTSPASPETPPTRATAGASPAPRLLAFVVALVPGALAGAAIGVFGLWLRDPAPRAETFFLAAEAAWVLMLCGFALIDVRGAASRGAGPWLAAAATACAAASWTLLYGPHRAAVVGGVLAATVAATAFFLGRRERLSWPAAKAWAFALQGLVSPTAGLALYSDLLDASLLLLPLLWAVLAAGLLWLTARLAGPGPALLVATAAAIPGPGWTLASCVAMALAGAGLLVFERFSAESSRGRRALRTVLSSPPVRMSLAVLLAGSVAAAAYPWMRPSPVHELWTLLGRQPWPAVGLLVAVLLGPWIRSARGFTWGAAALAVALTLTAPPDVQILVDRRTEVLSAARFRVELPLEPEPVGTVVLVTDLVHGAALPPGTEVFRIFIDSETVRMVRHPVFAGTDTDEWAAGRPDLVAARGEPVRPWSRRISGDGRFFRSTFRTVVHLDRPVVGRRLILRRSDALPEDVLIRTHRLETWP